MYRGLMIVSVLVVCCLTTVGAIRCYMTKDMGGNMKEVNCSKVNLKENILSAIVDNDSDPMEEIISAMISDMAQGTFQDIFSDIHGKFPHNRTAANDTHNATSGVTPSANAMETCVKVTGTIGGTLLHE